jgi:hypothetical protein
MRLGQGANPIGNRQAQAVARMAQAPQLNSGRYVIYGTALIATLTYSRALPRG